MKEKLPKLAIVCPCYNEESTLDWSVDKLTKKLTQWVSEERISESSFIVLIDDGSGDRSWSLIEKLCQQNKEVIGIKLSANVGHQNALSAGLHAVVNECDCAVSLDIDLQDDLNAIDAMLQAFLEGSHMVFGVRDNRDNDSWIKRFFAQSFYKLLALFGSNTIYNHADYRLLSNEALKLFQKSQEKNLYLRGWFANLPLSQSKVYYARQSRMHGTTKYTLKKMLGLAWNGISGFSVVPLRMIAALGGLTFCLTLSASIYVLYVKIFTETVVPGWASTVIPIYLLGGLQLLALGVIGEYVGKVLMEVKQRPLYHIDKTTERSANSDTQQKNVTLPTS